MREMISGHLVERGFTVDAVGCAEDAYAALAVASYDALVLDLGLPDADGMELLREARARSARHLPALIVTARDGVDDRARGLNAFRTPAGRCAVHSDFPSAPLVHQPMEFASTGSGIPGSSKYRPSRSLHTLVCRRLA